MTIDNKLNRERARSRKVRNEHKTRGERRAHRALIQLAHKTIPSD